MAAQSVLVETVLPVEKIIRMYENMLVDVNKITLNNIPTAALAFSDVKFNYASTIDGDCGGVGVVGLKRRCNPDHASRDSPNSAMSPNVSCRSYKRPRFSEDTASGDKEKYNFSSDEIDFKSHEVQQAIGRLNECLEEENLKKLLILSDRENSFTEEQIVTFIGVHVVGKLTGNAFTNNSNSKTVCPCGCKETLSPGKMWIGEKDTWHGELGLLAECNATNIVPIDYDRLNSYASDEEDEKGETSQGDLTNSELKSLLNLSGFRACQCFAQAIVFSWTEFNRHPEFSPYIPTVVFARNKFAVVIYNAKDDELLTVGYKPVLGEFPYGSLFWLWIVLNHRLFFAKEWNLEKKDLLSGFHRLPLEKYKSLDAYHSRGPDIKSASAFIAQGQRLFKHGSI